jgi:probable O-glycosylation ligase (exosortase A-associated)
MRDIVLTLLILGILPVAVVRPWIGILAWVWFGLMNPHTLTWGFAREIPFAMLIAIFTLIGVLASRERKALPRNFQVTLLILLWLVFVASTIFAVVPDRAWDQLSKVSKILLFVFLSLIFFQDKRRLRYLLLTIALSIGFYGVKGGIFALGTGGVFKVYGPGSGFFSSNNSIGLALNTILPILFYLGREEANRMARLGLKIAFWLCAIAVVFTYSRGAFLGLVVVMAVLYLRGRRAVAAIAGAAILYVVVTPYLPERLTSRMASIETHDDQSAKNRLVAWEVAWRVAKDRPLLGAGFWGLATRLTYAQYGYAQSTSAHSIYFDVMADHGFIGFALFATLLASTLWRLYRLRQHAGRSPTRAWVVQWSLMLQACLIVYMANGAFQSAAYTDLLYQLVACAILLGIVADREDEVAQPTAPPTRAVTVPRGRPPAPRPTRPPVPAVPAAPRVTPRALPPGPVRHRPPRPTGRGAV